MAASSNGALVFASAPAVDFDLAVTADVNVVEEDSLVSSSVTY